MHHLPCLPLLSESGITAALPAHRGAAADEAGHPRRAQRDRNAPIDHTLKTHRHAHPIKTLLGPATKNRPRGKHTLCI